MRKRLNRPKNQLKIETRRIKIKRQGGGGGEMRERAMERLAHTKKRNGKDEPRKKRQKAMTHSTISGRQQRGNQS